MKAYNVVWLEEHCVNVEAKDEEEAVQKVYDGDYDEVSESAEIENTPEAYEIKLK